MHFARLLVLLLAALQLTGCATSSVFVPYPAQTDTIKKEIAAGQYKAVQEDLEKSRTGADKILYMMEKGRVSFLAKDYETSVKDFAFVLDEMEKNEEKAKVTVTGTAAQGSALLTNDNAIPYRGEGYERVFVHHYQALNYLYKGDLEAAGVEVRRANLEQEIALKEYEDEVDDALENAQSKQILGNNQDYEDKLGGLTALAGRVKNSFQNAYTFYVSAIIYEARGEDGDALIDYKKALEIYPNNKYLIANVARLAKRLGMTEDYERVKDKVDPQLEKELSKGEGRVVVLYEYGYAPQKQEVMLPLIIDSQWQSIAMPTYVDGQPYAPSLRVMENGKPLADTQQIVDVSALAAKALQEKYPMIIVRQISRMVLRAQTKDASNGSLFGAVASIGHMLLNRADRRSWLTLPGDAQLAQIVMSEGNKTLTVEAAANRVTLPVQVQSGKTTLVYVSFADGKFSTATQTF